MVLRAAVQRVDCMEVDMRKLYSQAIAAAENTQALQAAYTNAQCPLLAQSGY